MDLEINYYPLIDCNSDGTSYKAMIPTTDENVVKEHNALWVMEAVLNSFRLCCTDAGFEKLKGDFTISCPKCGNSLHLIGGAINKNKQGLYVCKNCRR